MANLYNLVSNKLEYDYDEPLCNRAKLDTGTHCNYRCEFCYYKEHLTEITSLEVIKKRVDYLVECGITEVDLSGGESSIHMQWFELLDYCKSKGLRISTLSNGYKFANEEFLVKSKDHGLEEILFSVHGYDAGSHNTLVGFRKGFERITKAIANAHKHGILVRINCTVNNSNFQKVDTDFVELIKELKPFELNFLTLNYWSDANGQQCISYEEVTPHIHRAIDQLKNVVKIINVRYTPYCFMKGYEQYVCNYYQHIYDIYDWNIAVYDQRTDPAAYRDNPMREMFNAARRNREVTYYKKQECLDCKYFYLCDGVENQIKDITLRPDSGERITKVNFYRKGLYAKHRS